MPSALFEVFTVNTALESAMVFTTVSDVECAIAEANYFYFAHMGC